MVEHPSTTLPSLGETARQQPAGAHARSPAKRRKLALPSCQQARKAPAFFVATAAAPPAERSFAITATRGLSAHLNPKKQKSHSKQVLAFPPGGSFAVCTAPCERVMYSTRDLGSLGRKQKTKNNAASLSARSQARSNKLTKSPSTTSYLHFLD